MKKAQEREITMRMFHDAVLTWKKEVGNYRNKCGDMDKTIRFVISLIKKRGTSKIKRFKYTWEGINPRDSATTLFRLI